jgi:hypothetical protein
MPPFLEVGRDPADAFNLQGLIKLPQVLDEVRVAKYAYICTTIQHIGCVVVERAGAADWSRD